MLPYFEREKTARAGIALWLASVRGVGAPAAEQQAEITKPRGRKPGRNGCLTVRNKNIDGQRVVVYRVDKPKPKTSLPKGVAVDIGSARKAKGLKLPYFLQKGIDIS